jgi:hypothetical protein
VFFNKKSEHTLARFCHLFLASGVHTADLLEYNNGYQYFPFDQSPAMNEFVIDFVYEQMPYTGLVFPKQAGHELVYSVKVESQNQEINLDIIANPCGEGKVEWCFT